MRALAVVLVSILGLAAGARAETGAGLALRLAGSEGERVGPEPAEPPPAATTQLTPSTPAAAAPVAPVEVVAPPPEPKPPTAPASPKGTPNLAPHKPKILPLEGAPPTQ